MKLLKLSILMLMIFIIQNPVFGQNQKSTADSINDRMSNLINSSNSFQEYKVIKTSAIQNLRKDIKDEVFTLEENVNELHQKLDKQNKELEDFKELLAESDSKLEEANLTKDQLTILGIKTQKSTYNFFVSILVSVLVLALVFFIYKYKSSNRITKEAQENLHKNEEEFASYKKKALETQQKLGRQIIDERNKFARQAVN